MLKVRHIDRQTNRQRIRNNALILYQDRKVIYHVCRVKDVGKYK